MFGSMTRHLIILVIAAAAAVACGTQRLYDGEPLGKHERAVVRADPAVTAGLPVQVRLRRVDDREVSVSSRSVALAPGEHEFLVDCRVEESGSVRRFVVRAEVAAGGRYRFVANASARNCEAVELIEG